MWNLKSQFCKIQGSGNIVHGLWYVGSVSMCGHISVYLNILCIGCDSVRLDSLSRGQGHLSQRLNGGAFVNSIVTVCVCVIPDVGDWEIFHCSWESDKSSFLHLCTLCVWLSRCVCLHLPLWILHSHCYKWLIKASDGDICKDEMKWKTIFLLVSLKLFIKTTKHSWQMVEVYFTA